MTTTYPEKLEEFIEYLASLKSRPELSELRERMLNISVNVEDMADFVHFNEGSYRRNRVFENDAVELLCLCWKSGQRSPIHDHANSACGVMILDGVGTETVFEKTPSGYIKAMGSTDYEERLVMVSEDSDTHQISNLQAEGQQLVTLHIYSPPLRSMKTYSIDSRKTEVYTPVNEVLIDGSGI